MSSARLMSFAQIADEFGPIIELPASRASGVDADALHHHARTGTLWTLVDGPFGPLFTSGYHFVNRLGYFSSAKAVPTELIVDEAPDAALVTCDACDCVWDGDLYESCPYCEDRNGDAP